MGQSSTQTSSPSSKQVWEHYQTLLMPLPSQHHNTYHFYDLKNYLSVALTFRPHSFCNQNTRQHIFDQERQPTCWFPPWQLRTPKRPTQYHPSPQELRSPSGPSRPFSWSENSRYHKQLSNLWGTSCDLKVEQILTQRLTMSAGYSWFLSNRAAIGFSSPSTKSLQVFCNMRCSSGSSARYDTRLAATTPFQWTKTTNQWTKESHASLTTNYRYEWSKNRPTVLLHEYKLLICN